ncbi:MAG: hypothetical protein QW717_00745 [Candidatus Bathyarchaeia archaeon]
MSVESSKTLGGVGALLMVVGFAGFFWTFYSGFLLVVGAILVLIALKGLADQYGESGIFNNALYGFLTVIAGCSDCSSHICNVGFASAFSNRLH